MNENSNPLLLNELYSVVLNNSLSNISAAISSTAINVFSDNCFSSKYPFLIYFCILPLTVFSSKIGTSILLINELSSFKNPILYEVSVLFNTSYKEVNNSPLFEV